MKNCMQKQNGSSLIEVLVTILIVSFGLLGVAGIIVNALKDSHSSYGRSQASWLALDIIDRMRANRSAAQTAGTSPYALAINAATPAASTTSVAQNDLYAWRTALASALPAGTGSVAITSISGTKIFTVTVTVRWDDSRAQGGSSTQTFSTQTQL
jgi:type IV pilus assembly protein PilV